VVPPNGYLKGKRESGGLLVLWPPRAEEREKSLNLFVDLSSGPTQVRTRLRGL